MPRKPRPTPCSRSTGPGRHAGAPRLSLLAQAAACLLAGAGLAVQAQGLPTGPQVVQGLATVATQGGQMTVRNSPNAIVNWQSFSIGAANGVYFDQASAASKVLNRVTGADPSQILGSLASNGAVWLLNPNGVLFGANARVDVASLVTSTLRLNDNDFLAGRYRFTADAGSVAGVRNEGSLNSSFGGQVVLLGSRVENSGSISAPGGQIALAAAQSVELVDTALPNLSVRVAVPAGEVLNLGSLVAAGGRIDVLGAIVNQQGLIQASGLERDAQGDIVLQASDTLTLGAGSRTRADGAVGVADAKGGRVALLGAQVGVLDGATVSASGEGGGGRIYVGGGAEGKDAGLPNARGVYIGPEATLRADATGERGDGGSIVVWSDEATRAYGRFSAHGGQLSGNGGALETSGGWLDARPSALDLSGAAAGQSGSWLLDPNNITIQDNVPDHAISAGPNFTTTDDNSALSTATIATVLNAGTSVIISTSNAGQNSQAGDITISGANIAVKPGVPVNLVLNASRNIVFSNSSITSGGAGLGLDMNAAASGSGVVNWNTSSFTSGNGGHLNLAGQSISISNSSIATGGAPLSLSFATTGPTPQGVQLFNTTVTTGGGDIRFGTAQQVCSAVLGCTADALSPWLQRNGDSSAVALGLLSSSLDAGAGRVYGGGAANGGVAVLLSGSAITARDIAFSGRSDLLEGIRISGGSYAATRTFTLDGLNSAVATAGLSIQSGSTLQLVDASAGADSKMSLSGSNRGASMGLMVSGGDVGSANETLISVDGAALVMQGTASGAGFGMYGLGSANAPGGVLINALGASTVSIAGSNLSNAGGGTYLSAINILGPQGGAGNRIDVLGTGGALANSASLQMNSTSLSSGSQVVIRGDGLSINKSHITGDAGVSLQTNANILVGAPVSITGSTVSTVNDGSQLRIEDAAGGVVLGNVKINSGVGVYVIDSTLQAAGSGSHIVFNGRGADGGGSGVTLARSTLSATNILGHGQGVVSGDGILVQDTTNTTQTTINATNLDLSGTSADIIDSTLARTHVGVKLGPSAVVNFSGRGTVTLSGDYVLLGTNPAPAQPLQMRGDPASVTVSSTQSQAIRNATLDFSGGSGTTVTLLSDSDSVNGGRVRLDRATVRTGGGDFTMTGGTGAGVGIATFDAAGNPLPLNSAVGEGATGAYFSGGVTVDAGVGKVSIAGQTITQAGTDAGSYSVFASGLNSITAGSIDILARLGAGPGIGFGVDSSTGTVSTLDMTAERITITAKGSGISSVGTVPTPAQAVVINSASTWTARNGGALSVTSIGGPLSFTGITMVAGTINFTTPSLLSSNGGLSISVSKALNLTLSNPAGATIGVQGDAVSASGLSNLLSLQAPTLVTTIKGPALTFTQPVAALGRLNVQTDKLTLQAGANLSSAAAGDAVVVSGYTASGVGTFTNNAGAATLSTPHGRWVLDLADPRTTSLGGLQSSFTAYNLTAQPWQLDASGNLVTQGSGNALGFALSTADIASGPLAGLLAKIYDAGRNITLDPVTWTISGLLGNDKLSFTGSATALLADKNVGQGKAVTLDASTAFTVKDAAGNPVYGYSSPVFKANVNAAPLGLNGLHVADKVYDGSAAAIVTAALSGVLAGDAVSTSFAAQFADSSVGAAKRVDYQAQLAGADAANYALAGARGVASGNITPASSQDQATSANQTSIVSSVLAVTVPTTMSTPTEGRVLDVMSALSSTDGRSSEGNVEGLSGGGASASGSDGGRQQVVFKSVNFQRLPRDEIQTLLAARAGYKKKLFAVGISSLEQDPALADVRGCHNEAELVTGKCLLTEALKQEIVAIAARGVAKPRKGQARKVKQVTLPTIERKLALLIGINKYQDKAIPELVGAVPDARSVREVLEFQLGYETTLVEDGSRESIIRAFNKLALEADGNDSVVIYYAGHGVLVQVPGSKVETGYWLPADSNAELPQTWISNADISRLIGLIGSKQLMLISDSCYSGALAGTERVQFDQKAEANDLLSRKAAVVMASGGEEPVADEGKEGHSVFTWYLMKSLTEVSGWQVGSTLFERVRAGVTKDFPQTPQYGASRLAGHQGNTDYLFERRQFETMAP